MAFVNLMYNISISDVYTDVGQGNDCVRVYFDKKLYFLDENGNIRYSEGICIEERTCRNFNKDLLYKALHGYITKEDINDIVVSWFLYEDKFGYVQSYKSDDPVYFKELPESLKEELIEEFNKTIILNLI